MTQSPTELIRKPHIENFERFSGTLNDHHTSPITNSDHDARMSRMNYSLNQAPLQSRKIFGFQIFVDNDILNLLQPEIQWFQKVKKSGEVESIKFNLDLNIPDLNGRNIQIYDKEMEKKYQSCQALLADIYMAFKKVRRQNFSIIIFVPEGMVSLLIGTKGYQINKIMRESHTTIVVNQPINRMTYRTVKIQGYHYDIAKACRIIYEILEDKSSIAYSIQKQPSQLDYSKARVKTKFILSLSFLNYLLSKKKSLIKKVEDETKCTVKFKEDTSSRLLKRQQQLCVLIGKLQDVQAFIVMLINLMQLYYDEDKKGHDYIFKMLIPSNYVTKLIGQKGYMIRDITQRSGGAQIKILSDRQSERDARQCIISINGTRQNKIDATCLILQQIQCFKNGGPILQSGKSINENLAQQFKNSLPLHKCQEFFQEEEQVAKIQYTEKAKQIEIARQNIAPENDNHDQEGLISAQQGEQIVKEEIILPSKQKQVVKETVPNQNIQEIARINSSNQKQKVDTEIQLIREPPRQRIKETSIRNEEKKPVRSPSRRSAQSNSSLSRSRKKRRNNGIKVSSSSSPSYQQDKQYVEVKLVIPKKLAQDHKQLKYIESLCHSEISVRQQRVEGSNEAIISVRGSLKDNSQCIKMLQKRILRLSTHSSTR